MADPQPRPTVTHRPTDSSVGDALSTRLDVPGFGPPAAPGELGRLAGYRVLRVLGRGGMGAVYLALHEGLRRKAALKVMRPEYAADPTAKERFLREARAAALVHSDHVVTIYDTGDDNGVPFIAMEFLSGYPLDEYLKRKGRLSVPQALRVGLETADGLAAAHALGLVHRDIKPANLWLEAPQGRIKILDFGLAKEAGRESAHLTGDGAVVGTPAFMSPEQARGDPVDHRTDLFSLGGVLYHLTTGRLPFEGPTVMAILTALATREPPDVSAVNPEVPPPLAGLIHRLLSKDPDARPQSAAEVAASLRAMERGETPDQPGAGWVSAVRPQVVYVPIHVTAYEQSAFDHTAFENLDDPPADAPSGVEAPSKPRARGGLPVWAVAAAVLLATGIAAGVFTVLKKPAGVATPAPTPGPRPAAQPPKVVGNPDRQLAEWILSKGGAVTVAVPGAAGGVAARTPAELPAGEFKVTHADFTPGTYAVTDDDLDRFAPATGLVSLNLRTCSVSDTGLEKLSRMPLAATLRAIEFESPAVTDGGFRHLARPGGLTTLRAYRTRLTDTGMRHLAGLADLTDLRVDAPGVTDAGVAHLAGLKKLTFVGLSKTGVTDAGARELAKLPALITVVLVSTGVGDATAEALAGVKTLTGVYLSGTGVTDSGVARLAALPKLNTLGLESTGVTDAALDHLAGTKTLATLSAAKTMVSTPGVKRLMVALPNCKVEFDYDPKTDPERAFAEWVMAKGGNVSVVPAVPGKHHLFAPEELPAGPFRIGYVGFPTGGYAVTDADLDRFTAAPGVGSLTLGNAAFTARGFEKLTTLPLAAGLQGLTLHNARVTDADLGHVARLKALRILRVGGSEVTDDGLKHLSGLADLIDLGLAGAKVTDGGLKHLSGLAKLENLDLADTGLTDDGLKAAARMPAVVNLHVSGTAVTDAGLDAVAGHTKLRKLDVRKTAVSTPAAKRLMAALPKCDVFYEYNQALDPDRLLAGWVAANGGKVSLDGKHQEFVRPEDFPPGPVRVTAVWMQTSPHAVTDTDLDRFRDCAVVSMAFGLTAFTEKGLEKLAGLPAADRVEMLSLAGSPVDAGGLGRLHAFASLRVLDLRKSALADDGLKTLEGIKTLRELNVQVTKVTTPGVKRFLLARPDVRVAFDYDPKADPDRRLAEWLQSLGGAVPIDEANGAPGRTYRSGEPLPDGPLRVGTLYLLGSNYRLTDADVDRLRDTSVRRTFLPETDLTDAGLEKWAALPQAPLTTRLDPNSRRVTDAGVAHLAGFAAMDELTLTHARVTAAGLEKLAGLKRLRTLSLSHCPVGDAEARVVARFPALAYVVFHTTGLTDDGLAALAGCKKLTKLDARNTKVTTAGVKRLATALPKCEILYDYDPKTDPDRTLAEWVIARGGKVTTDLAPQEYLGEVAKLPPGPFRVVVVSDVAGHTLTDADLDLFLPAGGLEWFSPTRTTITDDGLKKFAAAAFAPRLRGLGASSPNVTDAGLDHVKAFPELSGLNLDSSRVTDEGLRKLIGMRFKKLGRVQVQGTKVTEKGLAEFRTAYPTCEIVSSLPKP